MSKRCLILGGALNVFEDVERALDLAPFDGVIAAKRVGVQWPGRLDAWASLHGDMFIKDIADRAAAGLPQAVRHFVYEDEPLLHDLFERLPYRFEGQTLSGSSGLFAVKVALALGYDRNVLCGMPLVREGGKIEKGPLWDGAQSFRTGFVQARRHIAPFVRSMSGWTKLELGAPDAAWLA